MTKAVAWGQKGVGGLNLGEVGGRNRTWRHAQIFFPGANVLIISNAIKQFKSPKDQALASCRPGAGTAKSRIYFPLEFSGDFERSKKCREIQGGGWGMTGERIGG